MYTPRARINHQIKAPTLRVIGPEGENFGVLALRDALLKAQGLGMDLIEISPNATPPVAKVMDYGKFSYTENKKLKIARAKEHRVEIKNVQVKIGTGEHDLLLKAKKASAWLSEGHRVKADLFLPGRAKYLDEKFLRERLERLLKLLTVAYKLSEQPKKSPKGMTVVVEKA